LRIAGKNMMIGVKIYDKMDMHQRQVCYMCKMLKQEIRDGLIQEGTCEHSYEQEFFRVCFCNDVFKRQAALLHCVQMRLCKSAAAFFFSRNR
jgi:hypothetical protein